MKKFIAVMLLAGMCLSAAACSTRDPAPKQIEPQVSQMKSICELATMQCYFHNVAKYTKENASGALFWTKDRHFWVEYSGVVTVGVDASLITMEIEGDTVTITIPPAKVLDCKVDPDTLTAESVIVAPDSAAVKAEHQTEAFSHAQENMLQEAENDTALLTSAQQRVQKLLEDYVNNLGSSTGISYQIKWVYVGGSANSSTSGAGSADTAG